MKISDIMSKPVETVKPTLGVDQAGDVMRERRLHHLIVKDGGTVVGVLSASDLATAHLFDVVSDLLVSDVMSDEVLSIDENEPVTRAARLMRARHIGCLAVTEHGKLVGIVTVSDLLRLLGRRGARCAADGPDGPRRRVRHRKQRNAVRAA